MWSHLWAKFHLKLASSWIVQVDIFIDPNRSTRSILSMVSRRPFLFLLLLLSYVLYLVIGAIIFSTLEQPYEDELREKVEDLWTEFLEVHPCLSGELLEDFLRKALLVKSFGVSILRNISGLEVKWDFVSSLFFTGTTLTTIGR